MTGILIEQGTFGHTEDKQGEGHGTTEAAMGVMQLETKQHQGLWTVPRRKKQGSFRRSTTPPTSWFLAARTVRRWISVVWSHAVCGHLFQQPYSGCCITQICKVHMESPSAWDAAKEGTWHLMTLVIGGPPDLHRCLLRAAAQPRKDSAGFNSWVFARRYNGIRSNHVYWYLRNQSP